MEIIGFDFKVFLILTWLQPGVKSATGEFENRFNGNNMLGSLIPSYRKPLNTGLRLHRENLVYKSLGRHTFRHT
jgi:hypothetical protein